MFYLKKTHRAFSKGYQSLHLTLTCHTTNQYSRVWLVTPKGLIFAEKCECVVVVEGWVLRHYPG